MLENHTHPNTQKKSVSAAKAAFAGAVVGAVGATVAVALKDQKNRKKVKRVINDLKGQATEYMTEIKKTVGDKEQLKERLAEGANRLQDAAMKAKKQSEQEE